MMEFLILTALTNLLVGFCCLWVLKYNDSSVRAAVAEKEKLRGELLLAQRRIGKLRGELKRAKSELELSKGDIEKLRRDLWLAQHRIDTLAIHLSAAVRLGKLPSLDMQCQQILQDFESTRQAS